MGVGDLQSEFEALKTAHSELESKMGVVEHQKQEAMNVNHEMKQHTEVLERELEAKVCACEEFQNNIDDLRVENDEIRTEMDTFIENQRDQDENYKEMEGEVLRATQQLEEVVEERDDCKKELEDAQDIIQDLRGEVEENNDKLRRASEDMHGELEEMKRKMTVQFEEQAAGAVQIKKDLEQAKEEVAEATNQKAKLRSQVTEKELEIEKNIEEIAQLKERVEKADEMYFLKFHAKHQNFDEYFVFMAKFYRFTCVPKLFYEFSVVFRKNRFAEERDMLVQQKEEFEAKAIEYEEAALASTHFSHLKNI